jgi:hypothetical protein
LGALKRSDDSRRGAFDDPDDTPFFLAGHRAGRRLGADIKANNHAIAMQCDTSIRRCDEDIRLPFALADYVRAAVAMEFDAACDKLRGLRKDVAVFANARDCAIDFEFAKRIAQVTSI